MNEEGMKIKELRELQSHLKYLAATDQLSVTYKIEVARDLLSLIEEVLARKEK